MADIMFKTLSIKGRKIFARWPQAVNAIDHRPYWARVLEALQYEQYIDRKTPYDEIDEDNTHPLDLSVNDYKDAIGFLDSHNLIDFPPEEGATFEGITTEGFVWIKDRQRVKSQAKQSRSTSKLTLALVIASAVTLLNSSGWRLRLALLVLAYVGFTVVYDIIIRSY